MIRHLGSKISLIIIIHRLIFLLTFDYSSIQYLYKCFILVDLSVFEFVSVVLSFVCFTLTKEAGVLKNYVITCVNKV